MKKKIKKVDIPLPAGVLRVNYGVPIIIAGMKADILEDIEKEKDGDFKLEFLHYSLRNYCLPYASTLIYTSSKQNSNLDIFYEYMTHRFFGFDLKYKAEVIHKDYIFIPSGYDNEKLLTQTFTTIKTNVMYEDIFIAPTVKKIGYKDEVVADDHQTFLTKIKERMGSNPVNAINGKPMIPTESGNPSITRTGSFYKDLLGTSKDNTPSSGRSEDLMRQSGKPTLALNTTNDTSAKYSALLSNKTTTTASNGPDGRSGSLANGPTNPTNTQIKPSGASDKLMDLLKKK